MRRMILMLIGIVGVGIVCPIFCKSSRFEIEQTGFYRKSEAISGVGVGLFLRSTHKNGPSLPSPTFQRTSYDPTLAQKNVEFHAARVRRDPQGAIGLRMLAGAYLQRCRETGDLADALRAEQTARRSLAIRTRRNAEAYDQLALSLAMQHRFREAMRTAKQALAIEPEDRQALHLCVEAALELGDYDAAEHLMHDGKARDEDAFDRTLRARMLELDGSPEQALRLYRQAQAETDKNYELTAETAAWFPLRVGDCLTTLGRTAEAEQAYQESLREFPRNYKAMTGLARLAAGRGDWQAARAWAEKSAAIVPTPDTLALAGDAYMGLGDKTGAERQYQLIETIGRLTRAQGVVYDRQRALYCADHGRNLDEALQLARHELKARHDIYAYDTLAWVCCRKGLLSEARQAMQKALARGTRDAKLFYHAGCIALAAKDRAGAKTYLKRALATSPTFYPGADEARRRLAVL